VYLYAYSVHPKPYQSSRRFSVASGDRASADWGPLWSELMSMIREILFPVDFSPSCVAMAPFAKRAASIFNAKITLTYVLQPLASSFELLVRPLPEVEENRECVAREKLTSFLDSDFPPDSNVRVLLAGDPASQISEFARERHFDLIVMPTHAGAFRRNLLGSTTAKVLDSADCPVLTSQHAETISPRPLEHREIVCAIDLRADSERILRYVAKLVEPIYSQVTIIHVIPPEEPRLPVQLDLDQRIQHTEREAAYESLEELKQSVGSLAHISIAIGPVKDALTEAARRLSADALVIGRGPQAGAFGRLRDLTYAVVRDAPCPVLSV
jgi:nucleotide-binding universal stress UspA family protein